MDERARRRAPFDFTGLAQCRGTSWRHRKLRKGPGIEDTGRPAGNDHGHDAGRHSGFGASLGKFLALFDRTASIAGTLGTLQRTLGVDGIDAP